jgi:hypothetical protein
MYKVYQHFSQFRSLFEDYPLLALASHVPSIVMPSAPSGPSSTGAKSTLVKPFVPPTEIKHLYDDFDDKVSLLMACNFAKNPDRQIRMFVETAVVMVC